MNQAANYLEWAE